MKKIFYLLLSILVLSCGESPQTTETPVHRNVIILLDLSDRLILNQNQVNYDKATIDAILQTYISSIKDTIVKYDKDFSVIKDKFALRIAEQKGMSIDKTSFEKEMQFNFGDAKVDNVKFILQEFIPKLNNQLDNLYNLATKSNNPKDYQGADIWKFLNEDLEQLIDTKPNTKNYLFIITDGYLYFENYAGQAPTKNRRTDMKFLSELRNKDWEKKFDSLDMGLIPPKKNFTNLNVAVMGVAPKDFWNEYDLLKKVWSKWFREMGIKDDNFIFTKNENSEVIKTKIKEFLK